MEPEGTAVVTGSNRGLGCALSLQLARRGFHVVATMRDLRQADNLRAKADGVGSLEVRQLDVTHAEDFEWPDNLRVLVNNAGIRLTYLPFEELSLEEWRETFETNVFGVVALTRRAVQLLRPLGTGVICNISSTVAVLAVPFQAAYRASKAAVSSLSETISLELAGSGVRVLDVPLGPVETELLASGILYREPEAAGFPAYAAIADQQASQLRGYRRYTTKPEEAARRIVDAILDDRSPFRLPCDFGADQQIGHWRSTTDLERFEEARHLLFDNKSVDGTERKI